MFEVRQHIVWQRFVEIVGDDHFALVHAESTMPHVHRNKPGHGFSGLCDCDFLSRGDAFKQAREVRFGLVDVHYGFLCHTTSLD